ncbi:MAG: AsmA-like C-terminal region-containing protein [Bacteroidota bacterium]
MKILLKILAALIVIVIVLIFILPAIYKSEIISLTKNELNKNVNATIDFDNIDLSLFSSFPDFNISIYGLNIVGKNEFEKDTLIKIERISMALDLFSVINSDSYRIKGIKVYSPIVNIKVLENGKSNYDISLPHTDAENVNSKDNSTDNDSGFNLDINKFHISQGELTYCNAELNTQVYLSGLNHTLSGKLATDDVVLFTNTKIASLTLIYEDIPYLSNVAVVYKASIDADIINEIYTLGKNELIINDLFTSFDGTVSYIEDDLNLILTFNSVGNKFKDILSLVPAIYANDFGKIETEGKFSINGFVKGVYSDKHIPSFNISASVDDAMFKYPDLPGSVKNIVVEANISNTGGDIDNTIIDIGKLNMMLGKNQFSANVKISTPISDPNIDTRIIGEINLADIKNFYPIEGGDELVGDLSFNVKFEGALSSIEENNLTSGDNRFIAMGSILARDINYKTSTIKDPINIVTVQLNFSPKYLDLVSFNATTGKNNIQATGKIVNYLPYYFNNGKLGGNLIINSSYLNIDELLSVPDVESSSSMDNKPANQGHTEGTSDFIVEIPDNINFTVLAKFQKLIYDSLEMDNVTGKLILNNRILQIKNLSMDAVEGKMIVVGSYSTVNLEKPEVDFNLNMKNMSIPDAYNQFAIIRNYLPLAKKTTGLFSADFRLNTVLDNHMLPVYSTTNGSGTLSTTKITINDLNSLTQIAQSLKLINFNSMEIDKIHVNFEFVDGKLEVQPTKFKYQNIDAEIEGWTSFDKSIGYTLKLDVPRSEFGSEANKVIDGLLAQVNSYGANISVSDMIPVSISIDGTLDNPKISTAFNASKSNTIVKEVKETVAEELNKAKEKLSEDAEVKAQKIIDDANKQSKQLIKEAEEQAKLLKTDAAAAKKNLITEADKQAKALIAEGKKNGFVAEMAAKEVAKQLKYEVNNNADAIIEEVKKHADDIIKEAKIASKKLNEEAKKEAKKVRGN